MMLPAVHRRSVSRWLLLPCLALTACAAAPLVERPLRGLAIPVRDPSPRVTPVEDDDAREDPPGREPEVPFALPSTPRERVNGGAELAVLTTKTGSPLVEVRLVVRGAGYAADGAHPGLADVAAQLAAFGPAGQLSTKDRAARFAALGASSSVEASAADLTLSATAPRERLTEVLEQLALGLRDARFEAEPVTRAKKRAAALAAARYVDSEQLALEQLGRAVLGEPYGKRASAVDLDAVTSAQLRAFFKQRLAPAALSVIVVGDIERADARAALEKALSSWKSPEQPAPPSPGSPSSGKTRIFVIDTPGAAQASVAIGAPGPERSAESFAEAALLSEVLGGGASGRLSAALSLLSPLGERARTTLISVAPTGPSLLIASIPTEPARAAPVVAATLEELKRAEREAPTDAELMAARRKLEGRLGLGTASLSGKADALAQIAALSLPDDALEKLLERARTAEAPALQQSAKRLAAGLVIVVTADASVAAPHLASFGVVEVLSPSLEKLRELPEDPGAPLEPPQSSEAAPAP